MIQLIGLLVAFYVAMRGLDWIIMSTGAKHKSVNYGRVIIGGLTFLGAGFFAILLISSTADMPDSAPAGLEDYTQ